MTTANDPLGTCSAANHSLRVKAAALYERAVRLHGSFRKDEKYLSDLQSLMMAFKRFSAEIPPFIGVEPWRAQYPLVDVELFLVHTIANITSIHILESHTAPPGGELPSDRTEAVLKILSAGARMVEDLSDPDYEYLDPFLGVCWFYLAKVLLRSLDRAATTASSLLASKLESITSALHKLNQWFPLAGDYLRTIQTHQEIINP
ncbi:hypothetical protein ONZ45_g19035 [Pleurotus djamor]|nr:hypothetical protein ONZ45_g19035 [Pleurotus djamor]